MADEPARRAWLTRVLGVTIPDDEAPSSGAAQLGEVLTRWRQARAQVDGDLAAFRAALLATEDVKADPRRAFVRAAAAEIPNMLPAPGQKIDTLLSSGLSSGVADPSMARDLLAAIDEYRRALDGAGALAKLETFATHRMGFPLALRATLNAAMDEIESTMRAAA